MSAYPTDLVPTDRVEHIAARGVCCRGCTHSDCDAVRLAREVLHSRDLTERDITEVPS